MKKAILAALIWGLGLAPVLAQPTLHTITMSGEGEVTAPPDMATLTAGVTSEAATAAAALSANSAKMQAVFAALKKAGVADRDMQTANFNVSPQMTGPNNEQARHITGYQVSNQVRVRLDDVGKLGGALDALVSAGANQIYGVNFSIKNDSALLAQARAQAVTDARTKAETYAKAAGATLGAILSIDENGVASPRPVFAMEQVMVTASRAAPTAVGESTISASVAITWEIQ
jgi:uncharacterized protein YggE